MEYHDIDINTMIAVAALTGMEDDSRLRNTMRDCETNGTLASCRCAGDIALVVLTEKRDHLVRASARSALIWDAEAQS